MNKQLFTVHIHTMFTIQFKFILITNDPVTINYLFYPRFFLLFL